MFVYNERNAERPLLTPWGREVKSRLIRQEITQKELIDKLKWKGFRISEPAFTGILQGRGLKNRRDLIHEVNSILEIPEEDS